MIPESVLWNFLLYFLFLIYLFVVALRRLSLIVAEWELLFTAVCRLLTEVAFLLSLWSTGSRHVGISNWGSWAFGDLSSWTRVQTHIPCIGRQVLNHWTTRKVLSCITSSHVGNFSKLSSHTTTTWEDPIHWKRTWYGEGLRAGAEWGDRGWEY